MSDIINQITDAIEAEIHEAWTESDADFNRGMEYAISIVKAVDIRTDSDLISRQAAILAITGEPPEAHYPSWYADRIKLLPSAETPTASEKHQLSEETPTNTPTDLISRQSAIDAFYEPKNGGTYAKLDDGSEWYMTSKQIYAVLDSLPSAPDSRQRGEWVRKYDGHINCYWYECDQCGEYRPRNQFGHEYNANFCPNCGSLMNKGGEDDADE